ncbi:MAG: hypothetical protein LIO70_06790 [Clostridiales bacterium]|nr:hypothetical protein [Clostridiales bacterium]
MNRWKQTLLGLLAAAALCCILPCQAMAANADAESEDLVYDLDGLLVSDNGEDDMNSWRYEDGEPIEVETEDSNDGIMIVDIDSSDSVAFGIDVSKWQGDIDWDSARSSISFAIIRCGYGSNLTSHDDAYFEANVEACEELGIPYGVYLYSYATSTTEAKSEANHVLRLLSGHTPSLPVYLDLEDSSVASACTNAQILASTKVFCNAIEDAGYEAGVYANKYWWTTYLTSSTYDQWDRWVAQYNTSCTYTGGSFSYWQYSSTGSVSGISGNVDCNYAMSSSPFYDSSTPKIANANLPSGNITATTYAISGIVSSSKKITKIAVNILDSSGTTVQTTTAKPNGKSYELAAIELSISSLTGGNYTCQVKATTSSGTTTVAESSFQVPPTLTGVYAYSSSVKVTWNEFSGATSYRVFRKTNGGSWVKLGDTTSTSYSDTTAVGGNTYTYTVRAITADGMSGYDATGKSITFLATPVISSLTNAASGVTVKWGAVSGVYKYRVYRRTTATSSWTKVADTTSTSYTDTTAVSGTTYYYTVRCVNSSGTGVSGYDETGTKISYLATPTLTGAAVYSSSIKVTWNAVSGATGYRVFRKTNGGSWVKLGDTASTTYSDTTAEGGNTYTYTVRALTSSAISSYNTTGKSVTLLSTPVISSLTNAASGVTVKWGAVSGVYKYRVYRRTASTSSWTKVADTTSTSYTDASASSGTTYYYTVRCVNSSGTGVSGYDETGKKITCLATPTLTSAAVYASSIKVTWNAVSGATGYRVFRKTNGGSWVKLGDTTSTTYSDTTAEGGNTYTYTVRAFTSSTISGYDATGKSVSLLSTPVISSLTNAASGVTVKWSAVSGVYKYRVYRRTAATSSWTKVADTTSTSYTDTTVTDGTTYYYTIRCVNSSGIGVSGYDEIGQSITYTLN